METRILIQITKAKHFFPFLFCLLGIIVLTNCSNQEKKNNQPDKIENKDTIAQKSVTDIKVDTTKGVFLIYKFGDSSNVVFDKTWYMVKNGTLSKVAKYDALEKTYNNTFYYNLLLDSKYSTLKMLHEESGQFVPDDYYLNFTLDFEYFDFKLYKIRLYCGISHEDLFSNNEQQKGFWETSTRNNIKGTIEVYSKKYKGWNRSVNEFGLVEYSHHNENTKITIQDNYYGVSVIYTDLTSERKLSNQEKENLKKKMEENNRGI